MAFAHAWDFNRSMILHDAAIVLGHHRFDWLGMALARYMEN